MPVDFTIYVSNLGKAVRHLLFNRGQFADTDQVDLLISEIAATFRTVGTETEVPINGTCPGTARIPLRLLKKFPEVARTYKQREIKFSFAEGMVKIGTTTLRHPDIVIGAVPDRNISLPADAGIGEILAIASLLSPEQVLDQGLRQRVENARKATHYAIANATSTLAPFGVSSEDLQKLVDSQILKIAKRLKKALRQN